MGAKNKSKFKWRKSVVIGIIYIVLIGLASYFTATNNPSISADIKSSASESTGLYGYKSKNTVTQALKVAKPTVPQDKQVTLIDKLSSDGYFWMKTKQEKLDYIHKNLPNNQYLSIVADAEGIHSWNIDPDNTPVISYSVSKQTSQQLADETTIAIINWKKYYDHAIKNCVKNRSILDKLKGVKWNDDMNKVVDEHFGYLSKKLCWDKKDINDLYLKYFTDLSKTNKERNAFTPEEVARIKKIVYDSKDLSLKYYFSAIYIIL